MSGGMDSPAASEWRRARNYNQAFSQRRLEQDARQAKENSVFGKMHTKPSSLGTQIDAMIDRLKQDGHSDVNIARVMRLRADKMDKDA